MATPIPGTGEYLKMIMEQGAARNAAAQKPKDMLLANAQQAGQFAGQGIQGYGDMTGELAKQRQFLMDLASGKHSVAGEQLRQGMQQNIAGQQSMAAGARPGNQAMAARTAMMNAGRIGSGLAGQQALAGLQERQQAQQALAQLNLGQRGQDVGVGLGGLGASTGALGTLTNIPKEPGFLDKLMGMATGLGGAYLMGRKNE